MSEIAPARGWLHGRPYHASDPLVAAAGDVQVGIFMLGQQVVHGLPGFCGQGGLHQLVISLSPSSSFSAIQSAG